MTHRYLTLAALFIIQASACLAAVLSENWTANIKVSGHYSWTWKQGESIDLNVDVKNGFKSLNLTGATVKFMWHTNAADNIWWEKPVNISNGSAGRITVTWLPSMDVGASQYAYWFGIWPAGCATPVWRIAGKINLDPSPGFIPNTLPQPIYYLDFNALAYTNAPWATTNALTRAITNYDQYVSAQLSSISNYTVAAQQEITDKIPPPFSGTTETITVTTNATRGYVITWLSNHDWAGLSVGDLFWHYATAPASTIYYRENSPSNLALTHTTTPPEWHMQYIHYDLRDSLSPADAPVLELKYENLMMWKPTVFFAATNIITSVITTTNTTVYATTNHVADAISAHTVLFTDCLLYTQSGTNYFFRWSETANTYIVTGVPQ